MNKAATYRMETKGHDYYLLAEDGGILRDGSRGMEFSGENWKIIGFTTRHNSSHIITLQEAIDGASIGQGWVHDLDHGAHRMWAAPSTRRAVSITRL